MIGLGNNPVGTAVELKLVKLQTFPSLTLINRLTPFFGGR